MGHGKEEVGMTARVTHGFQEVLIATVMVEAVDSSVYGKTRSRKETRADDRAEGLPPEDPCLTLESV